MTDPDADETPRALDGTLAHDRAETQDRQRAVERALADDPAEAQDRQHAVERTLADDPAESQERVIPRSLDGTLPHEPAESQDRAVPVAAPHDTRVLLTDASPHESAMPHAIRVLLADDEPLVRSGLSAILSAEPDIEVVGEAETGAEAVAKARALTPDVVLTDVRMPALDGIQAAKRILDTVTPAPRVVVITTFENDDHVYDALLAGAAGFLLKRARPTEIVQAVRMAALGDTLMFPDAIRGLALKRHREPKPFRHPLSDREQEVLRLMAAGMENTEIAKAMFLGSETVKTYVANVLTKLGARNRTHAVVIAYQSGFVVP